MSDFIRKSTRWFVALQIVLVVSFACSSKDPVEPSDGKRPTCMAASDSLVGWWPLDQRGTAAEELAGGNDGTYSGNPSEAEGKVAGALRFDGVNDVVVVDDPGADWTYDITGSITLEAWIKREAAQPDEQTIAGKANAYALAIKDGRVLGNIDRVVVVHGTLTVTVGEWHHIAVTYDPTDGRFKAFLDGEVDVVATTTIGRPVPVNDNAYNIGGFFPAYNLRYFQGIVDEVSVYNTALSDGEVREIYNHDSRGKCK
jgi:hypothetical protein